jgi:hypothetical protein
MTNLNFKNLANKSAHARKLDTNTADKAKESNTMRFGIIQFNGNKTGLVIYVTWQQAFSLTSLKEGQIDMCVH